MRKRVLSPTSKVAKGKRRCISNLFWDFLPLKFSQGRRLPIRARRRLLLSNSKRPKSEIVQPTSSRQLYYYSDCKLREDTLAKERFLFINWVDSVVKMHQGQTLEEFRIDFPLEQTSSHVVDAWIELVFSKRVQQLVLNLSPIYCVNGGPWNYSFPKVVSPVGLTSLTILYLEYVNVKQEVVEHIISKCPVLEQFSLFDSVYLGHFKLAGAALKLKHLSLFRCSGLKCIEIYDTNIVSFKYVGWRNTILHLENLPCLVELYAGVINSPISYVIDPMSGLFSQLETLTFEFGGRMSECYSSSARPSDVDYFDIAAYPELTKLRHLIIKMEMDGDFGLLKMIPLINACPYLQRFVLQLSWDHRVKMTKKVVETIECPHQHLKVVELAGYYGRVTDVEFAKYFIHNAVALERMIIIPKCSNWELPERNYKIVHKKEIMREEKARCRAKEQLQGNVPPTIDLVIH
ncbi:hypothetical protein COLO4_27090 [Corchorus olitorius]|uniref:At1g61320/AtMIF1 LRR domain-containing protein n=1 Tax=Corchorus olitorius TaxID=93759 RepID=A0A1R3HTA9_9ROSI|nr:hypothetical protein COLO4_27090 [Corchorus olitorius]